MTVPTTVNEQMFVANIGQTQFIFTIPAFDPTWFFVTIDDIPVDPADFSVVLYENQFEQPGGVLTFALPFVGGEVVNLSRRAYGNFTQPQSFGRYSAFPSRSIERALDAVTMGIQDLETVFLNGVAGPAGPTGPQGPAGADGLPGFNNTNGFAQMRVFGVTLPALAPGNSDVIDTYSASLAIGPYITADTVNGDFTITGGPGTPWLVLVHVHAVVEYEYTANHAFLIRPRLNGSPILGVQMNSDSGSSKVLTVSGRDSVITYDYMIPVYITLPTDSLDCVVEVVGGSGTLNAVLREMIFSVEIIRTVL